MLFQQSGSPSSVFSQGSYIIYVQKDFYVFLLLKLKGYIPLRRKTICVRSWRWLRPSMPQFRVGGTNMLVSKNAKICVTPNAKPQHEPMEYRLRWVPNTKFVYPTRTQFAVECGLKDRVGWLACCSSHLCVICYYSAVSPWIKSGYIPN